MIFISAPDANFDAQGNLTNLVGATLWSQARLTFATGTYRVTTYNSVSDPFTTSGSNGVLGETVTGNALRSFLFAPTENFSGDRLTSLTGCLLSKSQNVIGLLGGASYRVMILAEAAPTISVDLSETGEWVVTDTIVEQAPTPAAPAAPSIVDSTLFGTAGRYRIVNATQGTDAEYDLIPPSSLSTWAQPGESVTVEKLVFSSNGPEIFFQGFTETETWSAYANGNTFTQLDALYDRTTINFTPTIITEGAGLACQYGLNTGTTASLMAKATIAAELATRIPSERVQVLAKMKTGAANGRGGIGYLTGAAFTGLHILRNTGTTIWMQTEGDMGTVSNAQQLATGVPDNTLIWLKMEVEGTALRAKYWVDGAGEPGSWTTRTHSGDVPFASFGLVARLAANTHICVGYSIGVNTNAPTF